MQFLGPREGGGEKDMTGKGKQNNSINNSGKERTGKRRRKSKKRRAKRSKEQDRRKRGNRSFTEQWSYQSELGELSRTVPQYTPRPGPVRALARGT